MADIKIPTVERNAPIQGQSVGRDTLQMRDTSTTAAAANKAIVSAVTEPAVAYGERQAKIQQATNKFNAQGMLNQDEIQINKRVADYSAKPNGMKTPEETEQLRQFIINKRKSVLEDPDISSDVKSVYKTLSPDLEVRKLKEVEGKFSLSETIRAGQVHSQSIELAKKNVSESALLLNVKAPEDGFALIDIELNKIKDVKNSPFTSVDDNGEPIFSKQQSDLNVAKNVSQALTETIKRQVGVGENQKAKLIFEKYKDQIASDQIDNLQTIITKNETKEKVDNQVRNLRYLPPEDAAKVLNAEKDLDVRDEIERKLYTVQTRDRVIKEQKTKQMADLTAKKIYDAKLKNPMAYGTIQDLKADPDVAANWDKFTVEQRKKLTNIVVRPKLTDPSDHANVEQLYMQGKFAAMDESQFLQLGLGSDLFNSYRKKWVEETTGYSSGLQKGRPDFKNRIKSLMKKDKFLTTTQSGSLTPAAQNTWTNTIDPIVDQELNNLAAKGFATQEEENKAVADVYAKAKNKAAEVLQVKKKKWFWQSDDTPAASSLPNPTPPRPSPTVPRSTMTTTSGDTTVAAPPDRSSRANVRNLPADQKARLDRMMGRK